VIHNTNNINLNDIYSARLIEIQGHDGRARKVALVELVTSGFEPDFTAQKTSKIVTFEFVELDYNIKKICKIRKLFR